MTLILFTKPVNKRISKKKYALLLYMTTNKITIIYVNLVEQ